MDAEQGRQALRALAAGVGSVVLGKEREVELAIASLLAGGHILLEDIPGTGKTTLARALAAGIGGTLRRIQFTADLLPQDVVGVHVFDAERREFRFAPGPVFAHVVLADEINRASPRAQSALLEAMSEGQVSLDDRTYPLPEPFLVIATQNPFEHHGTYPLPESQLDRFNVRIRLSYPDRDSELRLIQETDLAARRDGMAPVLAPSTVLLLRRLVRKVAVHERIVAYIRDLAEATRAHPAVRLGVSPRGAIGLRSTAQALAFLRGRDHVVPADVKAAAVPVLCHRLFPKNVPPGAAAAETASTILAEILEAVPAPR